MTNKKGIKIAVNNDKIDKDLLIDLLLAALRPFAHYYDGISHLKGTSLEHVDESFPLLQSNNGNSVLISDFLRASRIIARADGDNNGSE
jgi:hypothetical protein